MLVKNLVHDLCVEYGLNSKAYDELIYCGEFLLRKRHESDMNVSNYLRAAAKDMRENETDKFADYLLDDDEWELLKEQERE